MPADAADDEQVTMVGSRSEGPRVDLVDRIGRVGIGAGDREPSPVSSPTKPGTVTVAGQPGTDVPAGTINSVLKQAGLKK
jgi:hypothetical protein